ncbi:MAG: OmpA family protein [Chitinophagaceae bacterium]|nr:OmpA family protein [Chitinophagaceae bacterium]
MNLFHQLILLSFPFRMNNILPRYKIVIAVAFILLQNQTASSQTNLLLNAGFEDINTCTEYTAECGVEAWFYLKDVKAQMLTNETGNNTMGNNSYGIFYNWNEYTGFTPIIGTILPCGLQKGNQYSFRGLLSAKLNPRLVFKPGICTGEKFYVPGRAFSKKMQPDSIIVLRKLPGSVFYEFQYDFIATGTEKYLTFGSFIEEEIIAGKKKIATPQTISIVIDNFQLIPADKKEILCDGFISNKERIYAYNFRHKEMDYSLFGKGELAIKFSERDSSFITQIKEPEIITLPKADTLKLGDVFFDFNKANLKPAALDMLAKYFVPGNANDIDSIYIEGHTDSIGTDKRNMQLSIERCESVKNWLLLNNIIAPGTFFIHPFGKTKPVATNKTAAGRALNRRVEIIVFRKT